jgi:uncharacterized protein (TIGR02145 family)
MGFVSIDNDYHTRAERYKIGLVKRMLMIRSILFFLATGYCLISHAQAPYQIPYQAIARDNAGVPISDTSISVRFSILSDSLTGLPIWNEEQLLTTNQFGLFQAQIGQQNSMATINWARGIKFMQVDLNLGNGYVTIGTQQLLSVPFALHANSVAIEVSEVGDTLRIGSGRVIIVPGISEANSPFDNTEHTCGATGIHKESLEYGVVLDAEGNSYRTIMIGSQLWMAENLNTGMYLNGDTIASSLTNEQWNTADYGAWADYDDEAFNRCPYGRLYNAWVVLDERGVCPLGWHVPTDEDWDILSDFLGGSLVSGAALKTLGTLEAGDGWWHEPNTDASNNSGFSSLPSGLRNHSGYYYDLGHFSNWWSSSPNGIDQMWMRFTSFDSAELLRYTYNVQVGFSIRCLRD